MPRVAPAVDVLLPTETINRELDFQLFLAARLVGHGHRVFLGRHDALRRLAKYVSGGRSLARRSIRTSLGRRSTSTTISLHEDSPFSTWTKRGVSTWATRPTGDECCCVGSIRDAWTNTISCAHGATSSGRFTAKRGQTGPITSAPPDTLGSISYRKTYRSYFDDDARRIREHYGRFVLINTSTSVANHGAGLIAAFSRRAGFDVADTGKRLNHMSYWAHATHVLVGLMRLTNRLSLEFPKLKFVIRPHPSENRQYYEDIFRDVPNVLVVHEGSVTPWLFACAALIHSGCTTAIEAWLSNVPVIRYRAALDARYERVLPEPLGADCRDEEHAIAALEKSLDGREHDKPDPAMKLPVDSSLISLRAEALGELTSLLQETLATRSSRKSSVRHVHVFHQKAAAAVDRAKRHVRPFLRSRRIMQEYSRSKFYGFHAASIPDRLRRLAMITGIPMKHAILDDALLRLES